MEAMSDLLKTNKDCGGNPNAMSLHPKMDEQADTVHLAIKDLRETLEMSPESGLSTSLVRLDRPLLDFLFAEVSIDEARSSHRK